ncbi:MAG: CbtA family protein [Rhodospirillales bacterium]|nr:CbtA family protein [Rhodospirillales bacterium]
MFSRIVLTALAAGVLAGVCVFVAHMLTTTPLIQQAEVYELSPASASHTHNNGNAESKDHSHQNTAVEESMAELFQRHGLTLVADLLMSIGFGFALIGAIILSGREIDWRQGLVWGLCGFAAFYVSPTFGLPPEMPGMVAADVTERQIWWVLTAAAAIAGLALIFFVGKGISLILAAILIVLPHIIGAPGVELQSGDLPAELAARFAVVSLVVTGLFWLLLGGLTGFFYDRFGRA